jgi:hypothetical protein
MLGRPTRAIWLLLWLVLLPARIAMAQEPAPDTLAAAKELIGVMNLTDQYKVIVLDIIKTLKPSIVQGRPEVDGQYDAITPTVVNALQPGLSKLSDAMAIIYARNFSVDDLHALIAFYKTPTGQKLVQKLPTLAGESRLAVSRTIAGEVRQQLMEELRNKGVNL